MKPIEAALEAWEKLPEVKKGESTAAQLLDYKLVKLKDMVLVMPHEHYWPTTRNHNMTNLRIVAFPRPGDFETFKRTSYGVAQIGYASDNREAIGTITLNVKRNKNGNYLEIGEIQGHYKKAKTNESTASDKLPDKLARMYGTWRPRALVSLIQMARTAKVNLLIPRNVIFHEETEKPVYADVLRAIKDQHVKHSWEERDSLLKIHTAHE